MAIKLIPLNSTNPAFEFDISLDGETYTFDFHFNTRVGLWFFSISKSFGEPSISPIPLIVDYPLTETFKTADVPPGSLIAVDESDQSIDPGREDLGSRVNLYYNDLT